MPEYFPGQWGCRRDQYHAHISKQILLLGSALPPLGNVHLATSGCTLWRISSLALSREPLYMSSYNFLLAGEQQLNSARCHRCMGQGISLCAERVIFRSKKGMLERRRKAVFYYCRVNLTILTLVNCQFVWGMGGWVWGVLFISNI